MTEPLTPRKPARIDQRRAWAAILFLLLARTAYAADIETTPLAPALPPGVAHAGFHIDTGGDRDARPSHRYALWVEVRSADTLRRQLLARCRQPSRGSALGGDGVRVLDVADCRHTFQLISEAGEVRVEQIDNPRRPRTVTRFALPAGVRAVMAPEP